MSEIMKQLGIEKVTLNIGVGKPGPELEKALKLIQMITGKKPVETKTKKRIPTWGIRPGLSIGAKVTIRGKEAEELLKRLLQAVDFKLKCWKVDREGNFAFGIREYIDIPGVKYSMEIGIMGLEVAVTMKRPGFGIKRRRIMPRSIPKRHRISKQETMDYLTGKYGVKFEEE